MWMNCCRSLRYDVIRERAVPEMPKDDSMWARRMEWSMVLKAAVRSRRRRMVRWPESAERRMLLVAFKRVVSVLWCVIRDVILNCVATKRSNNVTQNRFLFFPARSRGKKPGGDGKTEPKV